MVSNCVYQGIRLLKEAFKGIEREMLNLFVLLLLKETLQKCAFATILLNYLGEDPFMGFYGLHMSPACFGVNDQKNYT